jgi:hypothetical protein
MAAFLKDPHNNANAMATEALYNMSIPLDNRNKLLLFTIIHDNQAWLYTSFTKWQDGLIGNNPTLQNKFFALEGELVQDQGYTIELDVGIFNLPNAITIVPTLAVITAALTSTPTIAVTSPYNTNKPYTKGVKTMKLCLVPHNLMGM